MAHESIEAWVMGAVREWLGLARRGDVVRPALKIAIVAGTLLNAVNQGPQLLRGQPIVLSKVLLTFVVPYVVSTISAVNMKRRAGSR